MTARHGQADRIAMAVLILSVVIAAALVLLLPPVIQDEGYHDFCATASCCGVPHAELVLTNIPFLIVGALALFRLCSGKGASLNRAERAAWIIAACGVTLTAFGSAWYHASPDTNRLFWDRLPMTIAFAGLVAAVIGERMGPRACAVSLGVLLLADPASVLWWRHDGNLIPYAVAQFLPMLVLPLLIAVTPRRHTGLLAWISCFALYALAKAFELLDDPLGHALLLSGHGWKHLFAAAATAVLFQHALRRRELPPLPSCAGALITRTLKRDLFGVISMAQLGTERVVLRSVRCARWWARPLASALLLREETALAALPAECGDLVPRLRARSRGEHARAELPGQPLQECGASLEAFREARLLLRTLRRHGITHNDTHKPPNWIVLPDGRLGLIDFQLASVHAAQGWLPRLQAREDLRHLLKLQERWHRNSVAPRGRALLARKAWSTRLWHASGKKLYNFVTRRVLGWSDGEGRGSRHS